MKQFCLAVCIVLLGAGCSSTPDDPYADPRDPFEEVNRDLWDFNESLDDAVIRPAANAYEKVPKPIRTGLYNIVDNLDEPSSTVNNLLQLKVGDAGVSLSRFVLNSTIGLLGIFDVAKELGLDKRQEGFGEVLASWGVMDGPYLMLPGMGPTVVTDRGGDVVDGMYFPLDLLNTPVNILRFTIKGLDTRIALKEQEQVLENSLDPYAFVREAYFQRWRNKVYDGNPPVEEDEFDDDYFEDDYSDDYEDDYSDEDQAQGTDNGNDNPSVN